MKVYNYYIKQFLKQPSIFIFLIIFFAISVFSSNQSYIKKEKIGYIKTNSKIEKPLIEYLKKDYDIKEIKTDETAENLIFYKKFDSVVKLKDNKAIIHSNNKSVNLTKDINNFYNYFDSFKDKNKLINALSENIKIKTTNDVSNKSMYYFHYLSYALTFIILFSVPMLNFEFRRKKIRERISLSSITNNKFTLQIVMGNISFIIMILAFLLGFALIVYKINSEFILASLRLLAHALSISAIATLIAHSVNKHEIISGIANVLSLVLAFISGLFIPYEMLPSTLQYIAKFTPNYWYLNSIKEIYHNNIDSQFFQGIIIELMIFIIFTILALLVRKRQQN